MNPVTDRIQYSINAADQIVSVSGNWDRFALENDAPPELLTHNVLYRSFWDFVSGEAIEHVYRRIMEKVRAGQTLDFGFRCDSPVVKRFLRLRMTPTAEGGIEFVTATIRTEDREFQLVFNAAAQRSEAIIVVCSWCNKVRTHANVWEECEDAVGTLSLFESDVVPALSHGMCDPCYRSVMSTANARELAAHGV